MMNLRLTTPRRSPLPLPGGLLGAMQRDVLDMCCKLGCCAEDLGGLLPGQGASSLRLDVKEDADTFHVTADLAGLNKEDVDVTFHDGTLTIRGAKKIARDTRQDIWHITERVVGHFSRQLSFPSPIDTGAVGATFDKGVLTVTLPKVADAQKTLRKIDIQ